MRRALLLPLVLVLLVAAPAGAATVSFDGSTVTYVGAPGEINRVLVTIGNYDTSCGGLSAPCLTVSDGARITAGAGCVLLSSTTLGDSAGCPVPQLIRADLGDQDDSWWDWDGPSVIDAGIGNDNPIQGMGGDDVIHGGIGNDNVSGGTGNDTVDGGPGDDDLEGIPGGRPDPSETAGSDVLIGGGGGDSVTYESRTEALSLSPDGVANDGAAGENDNIGSDVLAIYGGAGPDVLTGNDARNLLGGGPGDDTLDGADGDDQLYGGTGDDHLSGGPGQDLIEGDDGNDVLDGGPDMDQFYGDNTTGCSPGFCPSGRDQLLARDGVAEPVDCGAGIDTAQVDANDLIKSWFELSDVCEGVDAAGGAAPAGGASSPAAPSGGGGARAALTLTGASGAHGRLTLRLTATTTGDLRVRATARAGGRTLVVAGATRRIRTAGPVRLTLRPSAAARRALRRTGRLAVRIAATLAGGAPVTATVRLRR